LPNQQTAANSNATSDEKQRCPFGKCNGDGWVKVIDDDNYERLNHCDCRKLVLMQDRLKFAQIPEEFKELRISDFNTDIYSGANKKTAEMVKKIAIGYINNFEKMKEMGKGLYLYGETKGSGKTRMAVSIGNALIRQHLQSVRFITTVNLINEIKNSFDKDKKDDDSFLKLLRDAKNVDVLILDDFGTEKPTNWVNEIFYTILNDRMTAKKITFFTSNCRIEDLLHDSRLVNRISRMATPIQFPEEPIRSALAKQENDDVIKILLGGCRK